MTIRTSLRDTGFRAFQGITRATLVKPDDSKKMQEVSINALWGEGIKGVEHLYPYGFNAVPLSPKQGDQEQPETLILNVGGSRSHPVALPFADRRHRPKNWEEGEVGLHDDQKQFFRIKRDQALHQSPKKTVTQLTDNDGQAKSTITQEATKTTIVRGKTTITIDDTGDKTTIDVDGTPVVVRKNRIDLGQENAPNAVMTTAGASTKVFSVI
jgi:phage gp45-like